MPTQQQVQNTLLNANVLAANLTNKLLSELKAGVTNIKWDYIRQIRRNITAVQRQYNLQDYSSPNFLIVYECLNGLIGAEGMVNIDPNAQSPETIIIVGPGFTPTPPYTKTQADLIEDGIGSGNWYLPFLDNSGNAPATGLVPVLVTTTAFDGSFTFTYNNSFTPGRIYGFTSNESQNIVVYLNL